MKIWFGPHRGKSVKDLDDESAAVWRRGSHNSQNRGVTGPGPRGALCAVRPDLRGQPRRLHLDPQTPGHHLHIANKGDHYKVQGLLRALGAVMGWTKTIKKGRWSASEGRWAAAKFAKNPHRCSTA